MEEAVRSRAGGLRVLARLPDIDPPPDAIPERTSRPGPRPRQPLGVGWGSIGGLAIVAALVCGAAWWVERDRSGSGGRRTGESETADSPRRPVLRMADSIDVSPR
jgi:ferric-dicitrate binding protein FerR (iron transport regulator)